MVWSSLDDLLLTGHDNGDLVQWDVKTGKKLKMSSDHQKTITDMQISNDASMLITSSKVPAHLHICTPARLHACTLGSSKISLDSSRGPLF